MRFIHTADLHLDAPLGALSQRALVRREALGVLGEMISYAKGQQIKYMVIAGDLFDTPSPAAQTLGAVVQMMREAPLTFIIAPGNHDMLTCERYLDTSWPENVHIFGRQTDILTTEDGTFIGVGFYEGMKAHPLSPVTCPDGKCVAVVHGSLGDSNPLHRIDENVLRALRVDYAALGHIHKGEDPKRACDTWIGTPGSPAPHGFDELGVRSFLDITVDEGGLHWQRINTEGVRFWEECIEVNEGDTQNDLLGRLMVAAARYGEKDIFRFRLQGKTLCSLPTQLEEYPALVEIINETTLPFSIEKEGEKQTLRGYFIREMLPLIEGAEDAQRAKYEAALRLGLEAFE